MSFHKYGSVGSRNYFTKYKGKQNGRLNSYHFNKFVRKPFGDKVFQNALADRRPAYSYSPFDSKELQKIRRAVPTQNLERLPAFNLWRKQLKENQLPRKNMLSDSLYKPKLLSAPVTDLTKRR